MSCFHRTTGLAAPLALLALVIGGGSSENGPGTDENGTSFEFETGDVVTGVSLHRLRPFQVQ